jgi:hypothetical protein
MSVTPTYQVKPLHELTEDWRRRLPPPVRETCTSCGDDVVSVSRQPGDVVVAVQRHQIEPRHIAADERRGIPLASWQLAAKGGR